MKRSFRCLGLTLLLSGTACAWLSLTAPRVHAQGGAPAYTVTLLGTLHRQPPTQAAGGGTVGTGLNEMGQVVGSADSDKIGIAYFYGTPIPVYLRHAFRWDPAAPNSPNGVMVDLGALARGDYSQATAINDLGDVTGVSTPLGRANSGRAFITQDGRMQALKVPREAGNSIGTDINNARQVSGWWGYANSRAGRVVRWDNGRLSDLGDGAATGINAAGRVIGDSYFFWARAFRTAANSPINPATDYLGSLGGVENRALDINTAGDVVGWSNVADGGVRAYLFTGGGMSDLAPSRPYSLAQGINDRGDVVGEITASNGDRRACLWRNGALLDLNTLVPAEFQGRLTSAVDINNAGQIVCNGSEIAAGPSYLLTPL